MPLSKPKNISNVSMNVNVTKDALGAELIDPKETKGRLSCSKISHQPNKGFEKHTHPSDHLLIILEGSGFLTYWEKDTKFRMDFNSGDVFSVRRKLHHAVTAGLNGVTLLAIGTPARTLNDPKRMEFV